MRIGSFDTDQRVLIVAEIGNNHEGDAALAETMVGLAAEAGADAVKFQTFRTAHYVGREDAARFEQLRRFELTTRDFERLRRAADRAGVLFLSTPFDLGSVKVLEPLVAAYKIASGDNTFDPLLEAVAGTGLPVILSTGLATIAVVRRARRVIEDAWRRNHVEAGFAVLHCVSAYPVPAPEANLAAIARLRHHVGGTVGYSDHTLGIEAAAAAVALGARIIEKHFTDDCRRSTFRDHAMSVDPAGLRALVERVRLVEGMLGSGEKVPQECELAVGPKVRRSIAAGRDLEPGCIIERGDLTWVRPAGGLAPGQEHLVVGRRLRRRVAAGERLSPEALEDGAP